MPLFAVAIAAVFASAPQADAKMRSFGETAYRKRAGVLRQIQAPPIKQQTAPFTVIGHDKAYQPLAKKTGGKFFELPSKEWTLEKNREAIGDAIGRREPFLRATPTSAVKRGPSQYKDELRQTSEAGYRPDGSGRWLLPKGSNAPTPTGKVDASSGPSNKPGLIDRMFDRKR